MLSRTLRNRVTNFLPIATPTLNPLEKLVRKVLKSCCRELGEIESPTFPHRNPDSKSRRETDQKSAGKGDQKLLLRTLRNRVTNVLPTLCQEICVKSPCRRISLLESLSNSRRLLRELKNGRRNCSKIVAAISAKVSQKKKNR